MESKPLDENLNGKNGLFDLSRYNDRHLSTRHMMKMLDPNPNLSGPLFTIAEQCGDLADRLVDDIADSPELTAGLRKLLEAKDCFVRAALDTIPESYTDR